MRCSRWSVQLAVGAIVSRQPLTPPPQSFLRTLRVGLLLAGLLLGVSAPAEEASAPELVW
jgi:hypothetical protein